MRIVDWRIIAEYQIDPAFSNRRLAEHQYLISRLAFGDVWVRSHQLQDNLPDVQASLHALVGLGGLI
jgi:hypothetical protein